jgi:Peptidase family M23
MSGYESTRLLVYGAAITFVILPLWTLVTVWRKPAFSAEFIVVAVMLLVVLIVGRWDLIGYGVQYLFLAVFLLGAYRNGGWIAVALSLFFLGCLAALLWSPSRDRAIELTFPLRAETFYVAHGGSFRILNQHSPSLSQRYALDIVQLNRFGLRAAGIYPRALEAYRIFGATVYSPCAGVVTGARDDLPDQQVGESDKSNPEGNHLVIRLDDTDTDIVLAHLMPGTLRVQRGERITTGQPLARVGNSGNTSEPHLHIHAKLGGETPLGGHAVPMRFSGRWLVRNSLVRS